jgi:uncharacterized OB-fold protein
MSYLKGTPLPKPHIDYDAFWDGCRRGALVIQRCSDCGRYRHYPRPLCPECSSWNAEWSEVGGRGRVWSWTIIYHSADPVLADKTPYNIVEVELEEGVRLTSNLIDCGQEEIYVGMPVEVVFEKVNDKVALPRFKRAPSQ